MKDNLNSTKKIIKVTISEDQEHIVFQYANKSIDISIVNNEQVGLNDLYNYIIQNIGEIEILEDFSRLNQGVKKLAVEKLIELLRSEIEKIKKSQNKFIV